MRGSSDAAMPDTSSSPAIERPAEGGRRHRARQRCLYACRIVYGPHLHTLDGVVRDLSDSGARIRVASPLVLPTTFKIILAREGRCHDAEVAWRRGSDMGLRFLDVVDLHDPADASIRLLRRLWAEMAGRASDSVVGYGR